MTPASLRALRIAAALVPIALAAGCCCSTPRCPCPTPCAAPMAAAVLPCPTPVAPAAAVASAVPEVLVEGQWLLVPEKVAKAVFDGLRPRKRDRVRVLEPAEVDAFLARAAKADGVTTLASPAVIALDGQQATVAVGQGDDNGAGAGMRLLVVPQVSADRQHLDVRVEGEWRGEQAPVKRLASGGMAGPPSPSPTAHELVTVHVEGRVVLPASGALLLLADKPVRTTAGRSLVVLVVKTRVLAK